MLGVLLACALARTAVAQSDSREEDDESALLVQSARKALSRKDYGSAARSLDRALRVNPRRIDAYVLRASVHGVKKEYAEGVALMQRARNLAPDSIDVLTALGTQLVLARRADEGVPMLEGVVARAPERYEAHAMLGLYHSGAGDYPRAASALEAYLERRPAALAAEDATYQIELGNAYLRQGALEKSEALLARAARDRPKNLRARVGLAWAVAARDCKRAMPLLEGLGNLSERVPEVLLVRGWCLLAMGRAAVAGKLATDYIVKRPESAAGHALRGEAYVAEGQHSPARISLEKAVRLAPDKRIYVLKLARALRKSGDAAGAVKLLEGAPEVAAAERDWGVELAEALLLTKRHEAVPPLLAPVVEKHPDDGLVRTLMGEGLLPSDPEAALGHLERAFAQGGSGSRARKLYALALERVGAAALAAGNLARADELLSKAEPIAEGTTVPRLLGATRLLSGRPAGALAPLAKATKGGTDASALALEGRALADTGKPAEARRSLERALELLRGDAERAGELSLELGSVELAAGQPGRALPVLEKALSAKLPAALKGRLEAAAVIAARAAATEAMQDGGFERAVKVLERAEELAFEADASTGTAVRCELAVAATGAGRRDLALVKLRALRKASAKCPFPAPADELAVPILLAFNEGAEAAKAQKTLNALEALRSKASGPAEGLLEDAIRWIALAAASDAWKAGNMKKAKAFLLRVKKGKALRSQELAHNLAVIDLEEGRVDQAIAVLEKLANEVPEALVHLGIAYERKGQHKRALELFEIAASHPRLRFAPIKDWVAAKQRVWGAAPGPGGDK